jgi:hypothetical protein
MARGPKFKIRSDGKKVRVNTTSPRNVNTLLNERKALQLRVNGCSYAEIGDVMKCTPKYAHDLVIHCLQREREDCLEAIPEARQIELTRLDNYLKALEPRTSKGDTMAIQTAIKAGERRSRLAGLDLPTDVKLTGTGEGGAITLEVFRKMVEDSNGDPDSDPNALPV